MVLVYSFAGGKTKKPDTPLKKTLEALDSQEKNKIMQINIIFSFLFKADKPCSVFLGFSIWSSGSAPHCLYPSPKLNKLDKI